MEDFLGMRHLGMNDANAEPMSDVFNTEPDLRPYTAVIPGSLCQAPVSPDLIPECSDPSVLRTKATPTLHDGAWWAKETKQFNFRRPDGLDASAFNHLLWRGIKGEHKPYPAHVNASRDDEEAAQPVIGKDRN
jgi:DNA-binding beta-propeller fold protein YncE